MPNRWTPADLSEFERRLQAALDYLPDHLPSLEGLGSAARRRVLESAAHLRRRLVEVEEWLDPIERYRLVDPSDPVVAAQHLSQRLEQGLARRLSDLKQFWGAGIYALYYGGNHPAYEAISGTMVPIYVGKADSADPLATTSVRQGRRLYRRLLDHRRSIRQAEEWSASEENLEQLPAIRVEDFSFRFLVLANAFAGAVEERLIHHYGPIWNDETRICFGIGKHGDKAATRTNTRSPWDTLHPGRPWALASDNVPNPKTWKEIFEEVQEYVAAQAERLPQGRTDRLPE